MQRRHAIRCALGAAIVLPFAFVFALPARAQPKLPPPPPPPLESATTSRPTPTTPTTTPTQAPIDVTITKPKPKSGATTTTSDAASSPEPSLDFLRTKRRIDAIDLAEKRDGGYVTALPLISSDPDTGFGFGARAYYYWDGPRDDPRFAYTPYLHRTYAQAYFTTNGYQFHTIDYDGLYVAGSPYRVRASLAYERNIAANYFGRGASTLGPLAFPGGRGDFTELGPYTDATSAIQANGSTFARYDKYSVTRPAARASVERDLFGGAVRVLAGVTLSRATIRDYSGANVSAVGGVKAPEAPTRLLADCNAGRIVGCQDGWNNQLKLGVAYDTRDFEPDPTSGVFADVTAEISTKAFGSQNTFARVTAAPRVFFSPFPKVARVVLAARAIYSVQVGDVPFYDMGTLAFTDGDQVGVGGLRTIRGYSQERFVGKIATVTNFEVRWTFYDFTARRQRFHFILVPFLDMGRVFDDVRDTTFAGWKRGQGAALRVGWNQATIVSFDYGVSAEGSALYVTFGHQF